MGRSDFNHTSTEFRVCVFVSNDWDWLVQDWQDNIFTNQIFVAIVIRVNRYGSIPKHSLRTSGRHFKGTWTVFQHVVHVVEGTFHILVNNLDIRKGCTSFWIPIDDKFTTVNPALLVELYKDLTNGFWQPFIKCETLTRIVYRKPHLAPLLLDGSRILIFPFPNLFKEFFTTKVITRNATFSQTSFYFSLSGNPSMVHTRKPKRIKTLHAFLTDDDILKSCIPSVTKVKFPSYVWWWNDDWVRLSLFIARRLENIFVKPFLVTTSLNLGWIVFRWKFFRHVCVLSRLYSFYIESALRLLLQTDSYY